MQLSSSVLTEILMLRSFYICRYSVIVDCTAFKCPCSDGPAELQAKESVLHGTEQGLLKEGLGLNTERINRFCVHLTV